MAYCHKCGKLLKESAKFCGSCGTKTKEKNSSEISQQQNRTTKVPLVIFIIFIIFILYLILNFWAISKLQVDTSASSIISSISHLNLNSNLLRTQLGTEIRLKNPTIIPILVTKISYQAYYGDTIVGKGGTGFLFFAPMSSKSTPIDFEIDHIQAGKALFQGIIDTIRSNSQELGIRFYAGIGPIKIPVGEIT